MPDKQKGFFGRIRGHAEWEGVKWGWALIAPGAYALYQKVRHFDLDWFVIGLLLCVCFAMSLFGYLVSTRKKQEDQTDTLGGLPQDKNQDEIHWKNSYLEEAQRRATVQNEYADAVNRRLQLESILSTRPELPLTSLQIQALQLAKDLRQFNGKFDFAPIPVEDTAEWIVESIKQKSEFSDQIGHAYVADGFADRVTTLVHKLGAMKMDVSDLEGYSKWVGSKDNVKQAIKALWKLTEEMEQ